MVSSYRAMIFCSLAGIEHPQLRESNALSMPKESMQDLTLRESAPLALPVLPLMLFS
jgi:hypothetical protein